MDPILFTAFLTTTLVFVATPGPSVAFATAQALRHGPRAAYAAVAGDALGTAVHICVAVVGLTALVALSEMVLPFLQILGGLFLVWMAMNAFRKNGSAEHTVVAPSGQTTFWAGFFACVTNPKAIVFFVALFPAFMSPDHSVIVQGLVYGVIFIVLDAVSILAYAFLTTAAVKRTASRWISVEVLSGLGLAGVGLGMMIKGYRSIPSQ